MPAKKCKGHLCESINQRVVLFDLPTHGKVWFFVFLFVLFCFILFYFFFLGGGGEVEIAGLNISWDLKKVQAFTYEIINHVPVPGRIKVNDNEHKKGTGILLAEKKCILM